jgi:hypothetical protein
MHLDWHFEQEDLATVRRIVEVHRDHPILVDRRIRNLKSNKAPLTRERLWRALMMALLTTQQPSGPTSAVSRILMTAPFKLAHLPFVASSDPEALATKTLVAFGGIRRHGVIGREIAQNLALLETGEWQTVLDALNPLSSLVEAAQERKAADYLNARFVGLGPKQSRNLIQALGLTRYEIPIDSRIAKWLRGVGFPVPIGATALSDRQYYCFILDAIQRLCEAAGVFPCELDGAVFASYDREAWNAALVQF